MSLPRERIARQAARAVIGEMGLASVPVDPFDIAKRKDIRVLEDDFGVDVYGACGLINKKFVIAISKSCPTEGHRRFTAAHELGHYHINGHFDHLFDGTDKFVRSKGAHFHQGGDAIEREADHFASELLMPDKLVHPLMHGKPNLAMARRIATKCGVSLTSATITMARLSGDPVAIFMSKDGVIDWPAFSPSFSEYPWSKRRAKGEWAPPRSGTKKLACDREAVREGTEIEEEGLLCEWYPDAPDSVSVTEYALGLGDYGRVLTILVPDALPDADQEQERDWRRQRKEWQNDDD